MQLYIDTAKSYAELLSFIYSHKLKVNHRYSIRAYAKLLKVSYGYLGNILKCKKSPSHNFIINTGKILGLNQNQIDRFITITDIVSIDDKHREFFTDFNAISEWEQIVIFICCKMEEFDGSLDWIVKKTGFELERVKATFQLLQDNDCLYINPLDESYYPTDKLKSGFTLPSSEGESSLASSIFGELTRDINTIETNESIFVRSRISAIEMDQIIKACISTVVSNIKKLEARQPKDPKREDSIYLVSLMSKKHKTDTES